MPRPRPYASLRAAGSRWRRLLTAACLALSLAAATRSAAQEQPTPVPEGEHEALAGEMQGETPRGAMRGFLVAAREADHVRAARFLDLRRRPPAVREREGPELARQLKAVLDRTLWVDLDALSADPQGEENDGLPARLDRVGTIETRGGPVEVLLERVTLPDGTRRWQIAGTTVSRVPALAAEFGYGWLAERLPAPLVDLAFLEVRLWQWMGLAVLLVLAVGASWVLTRLALRIAGRIAARAALDGAVAARAAGPVRLVLAALLVGAGSYPLALALPAQAVINGAVRTTTIAAVAWLALRLACAVARRMEIRVVARGQAASVAIVHLGRRAVQAVIVLVAVVGFLQSFGFDVTAVIAGLGLGGLAIALAAQKTLENLFAGMTLLADQPVRVGDFCRFGDRLGTVEDIGLRSTRLRTLERTVVALPNADFAALPLENFAHRDRIWLRVVLGLRYETTPDQLRWVLVELKRLLLAHPRIDREPARVRFVGFGTHSLDVELFAYVRTADHDEFLAIREDLFLRIMDVIATSGTGFAFPSQTTYAAADTGLDASRREAAEARVAEWRAASALPLPDPPAEVAASLAGTLVYPPAGSARRR